MRLSKMILFILIPIFSFSCSPKQKQETMTMETALAQAGTQVSIQESAKKTIMAQVALTQTAEVTSTPEATNTLEASPTITFTPTISPTPIPLNLFNPLTFVEGLRNSPNGYLGSYIKALGSNAGDAFKGTNDAPANPYWLAPADYSPRGIYVNIDKYSSADSTINNLENSKWMWIYGIVKETNNKYPLISVVHVDSIPDDQLPRVDGVYRINVDIAPGQWKSMSDATETQSCYWARIASDGTIIDNFFGYGGTVVNINDSDFAVEFKSCSIMVYLGK
jgi:hypothetical protein